MFGKLDSHMPKNETAPLSYNIMPKLYKERPAEQTEMEHP